MHVRLRDGRLVRVLYHNSDVYKTYTSGKLWDRSEWDEKRKLYVTTFNLKSEEVEEAFSVTAGVIYDTGDPKLPTEWILGNEDEVWTGEVYLHGWNYPGWEFIDRGESRKLVSLKECKGQFLQKRMFYRNGKSLEPARDKKVYLPLTDFKRGIVFYNMGEAAKMLSDYEGEPFLFQEAKSGGSSILEGLDAWKNG